MPLGHASLRHGGLEEMEGPAQATQHLMQAGTAPLAAEVARLEYLQQNFCRQARKFLTQLVNHPAIQQQFLEERPIAAGMRLALQPGLEAPLLDLMSISRDLREELPHRSIKQIKLSLRLVDLLEPMPFQTAASVGGASPHRREVLQCALAAAERGRHHGNTVPWAVARAAMAVQRFRHRAYQKMTLDPLALLRAAVEGAEEQPTRGLKVLVAAAPPVEFALPILR